MSDLFSSLSTAAKALNAQQMGLAVVGQNIANVNTPGYSRRSVILSAVPPTDQHSAGGGVDVTSVRAARDLMIERRLRQERPAVGREAAIGSGLSAVEVNLSASQGGVDSQLTKFFDAFSSLASDPTSAAARAQVLGQGQSVASTFNALSRDLTAAQHDADVNVRSLVNSVNDLSSRIATLNSQLGGNDPLSGTSEDVRDKLFQAVADLSDLIDVSTVDRQDGGLDVSFGNGRPIVIGATAVKLDVVTTGIDGFAQLSSGGTVVTGEVTGGQIGGWLHVRDVLVPDYVDALDNMAYEFAQNVNTLHDAGYDQNGNNAGVFFAPLGGSSGAAAALKVDAAIVADPTKIAAASVAVAGDNGTAKAIAALRDAPLLNGGTATLHEGFGNLVYRVGRDSLTAQESLESRGEILDQVQALRDSVSGVSLDEEAVQMMKFQRAYEANARFFQAIDQALDMLFSLGG